MKYIPVRAAGLALAAVVVCALEAEVRPLVVEGAPFPLTVAEWTPPARDFPVTDYGAKPDGTPRKLCDTRLIRSLGWEPKIRLEDGIRRTIDEYRAELARGTIRL